ncbi:MULTISPECIES: biotin/lipoyl-containing protein [unclassified Achromobacter]|uniref:biotin/lipoyl-containing protein n=1 Tax=unclassified Achromobacter TaxID=2626865 RepID=UPI0008ADF5E5|nr:MULTISPECIES: biotin/lipoyl-containing protein [unclassified Achromobacter]SEI84970.1 acetyl-CoA carboxylase biotin carboxyl carrier protein [Achromobacter sp. NFACC18-2]SIT25983.1 acetyl-CoA carboxylase biotin carboxyl carrier protein [Achromobacter sp. MFA1 R4]
MFKVETPVVGRVVAVTVSPGQRVEAGDSVAKVESMKMEIPVEAERAGVVARVLVGEGDEVDEGQVVVELE